jgi:hypothetical protein
MPIARNIHSVRNRLTKESRGAHVADVCVVMKSPDILFCRYLLNQCRYPLLNFIPDNPDLRQ